MPFMAPKSAPLAKVGLSSANGMACPLVAASAQLEAKYMLRNQVPLLRDKVLERIVVTVLYTHHANLRRALVALTRDQDER